MGRRRHDLIVIGAGPGGYVAAIRAAQLGLDAACVGREPALGGTCLRIGCIPSKALLESSELYFEARLARERDKGLAEHGVRVEALALDLERMLARKRAMVETLVKGVDGLFRRNKVTRYLGHGRLAGPGGGGWGVTAAGGGTPSTTPPASRRPPRRAAAGRRSPSPAPGSPRRRSRGRP